MSIGGMGLGQAQQYAQQTTNRDEAQRRADVTDVTSGTNPGWGFAARYNPSQLQTIWESPWAVLPDVFSKFQNPSAMAGPGYQALRDLGADPLTLYNIMVGSDANFAKTGTNAPADYANWLKNLYQSYGTVGGRGFSGRELLQNIFHPGANSSLAQILTAGNADTQMRTLFNLIREASNVGMNPVAARAYQAAAARTGDLAVNQYMKENADSAGNTMPVYERYRQLAAGFLP